MVAKKNSKKEVLTLANNAQEKVLHENNEDRNTVEALLFASGKYMPWQLIAEICSIDSSKVRKILEELKEEYDKKDTALMIVSEADSWKINVREKYLSTVRKIVAETELPRSTLETLAVIAWKSPIFQSEIVSIRGNKCYDHIAELENAGFVTKDKKGRSFVLKTTEKFFEYFDIDKGNLKSILEEAKTPNPQKTLEESSQEEQSQMVPVNIEKPKTTIEIIDLKKKTESEEEKEGHRLFLEQIEQKIMQASEKNNILDQELPKREASITNPEDNTSIHVDESQKTKIESANESGAVNQTQKSQSHISINESQKTKIESASESGAVNQTQKSQSQSAEETQQAASENMQHVEQQPAIQAVQNPAKSKSLTKKQLEKKFKEELLKVRERMEKNK